MWSIVVCKNVDEWTISWVSQVIDLEKCTISQVDPAGGKSQEFFDVVRYEKYCDMSFHSKF